MTTKKNTRYFINAGIAVAIMIFFRFIPPFGLMTEMGMTMLGIFVGLIWAWITTEGIWPSIVALALVGLSGYVDGGMQSVIISVASNSVVQMLIWLLVYSAILTSSGISVQLAKRMVSLRICKGHPWILTICLYTASLVCSAFGSGFAVVLVCWNLVYSICNAVGFSRHDAWPRMTIIAVVIGCVHGLAWFPFQAAVVGSFGYLSAASGGMIVSYDYLAYILFGFLFFIVASALYFICCRLFLKPDMQLLKDVKFEEEIEPFTTKQKFALGSLVALFLYMVLPSFLPDCLIKSILNQIGMAGFILLIIAVCIFVRDSSGTPLFAFQDLAKEGMLWDMIFMIGTAVYMGTLLSAEGSGFNATLLSVVSLTFEGVNPIVFCAIVIVVTSILTNVSSNAVTSAIMVPATYPLAVTLGISPVAVMTLIVHATEMGLMLPCSSPNGALLYGNQKWLSPRDIAIQSLIAVITTAIALIICTPLCLYML